MTVGRSVTPISSHLEPVAIVHNLKLLLLYKPKKCGHHTHRSSRTPPLCKRSSIRPDNPNIQFLDVDADVVDLCSDDSEGSELDLPSDWLDDGDGEPESNRQHQQALIRERIEESVFGPPVSREDRGHAPGAADPAAIIEHEGDEPRAPRDDWDPHVPDADGQGPRGRRWAVTSFDGDLIEIFQRGLADPTFRTWDNQYGVARVACQIERTPRTGRLHLQMYVVFRRPQFGSYLRRLLRQFRSFRCRGSEGDNVRYVSKEESRVDGPWYYPDSAAFDMRRSMAPSGTHLLSLRDTVLRGEPLHQAATESDELFPVYVRHKRALSEWAEQQRMSFRPRLSPTVVTVFFGPSGYGKSHAAHEMAEWLREELKEERYYSRMMNTEYFNGYYGEKIAILDEWDPELFRPQVVNGLLDKYPMQVKCFQRMQDWKAEHIFICTNIHPDEWIPAHDPHRDELLQALRRRLTHVHTFRAPHGTPGCFETEAFKEHYRDQHL